MPVPVTVPLPVPDLLTERVYSVGVDPVNVAVIVLLPSMVTVQLPVPEQPPPDQPVKVDPPAGLAVRDTEVPGE